MTDYLRIARAAMPDLKTAVTGPEYARAESPKIEAEADQVELERAGARISYMFARKSRGPLAGGSAKISCFYQLLPVASTSELTQGAATAL